MPESTMEDRAEENVAFEPAATIELEHAPQTT